MLYPTLQDVSRSRSVQIEFRGLNHNDTTGENEFYRMENMTGREYPVLSPREKRTLYTLTGQLQGMSAKEALCWVRDNTFYYNGVAVEDIQLTDGEKQLVTMGAYVVIFPDGWLYNTETGEAAALGAAFSTTDDVHFSLCSLAGDDYTYTASPNAPENPLNGDCWMDTSGKPPVLKQYSAASALWVSVPTVYVKIASAGIGAFFSRYDGVTVSGCRQADLNGDFVLMDAGEDYIVITGLLQEAITQQEPVTVERKVPQMDFVCEQNNRIWGCSSENHEIYACKLGDPKNWYSYAGLSTDSFAVTVGSQGDFTGCVSHLGYVLFFKEDIIHKIYGTKPANYQMTDLHARGVEKGSSSSLCIVNELLYYKSRDGICVYDGSLPQNIGQPLGLASRTGGAAGRFGDLYCLSVEEEDGPVLYTYHTLRGLWYREDNTRGAFFTSLKGALYFYDRVRGKIVGMGAPLSVSGLAGEQEADFSWSAETGDILYGETAGRYLSRLFLRLETGTGSRVDVYVQYDGGDWEKKFSVENSPRRVWQVPLIPRRCGSVRLKIAGVGAAKILAAAKTIEIGSENP